MELYYRYSFARILVIVSALLLAVYLELQGAKPCALCWFQRYIFLMLLGVFVFEIVFKKFHMFFNLMRFVSVILTFLGIVLALRHLWLIYYPGDDSACLPQMNYLLQHLGIFKTFHLLMTEASECSKDRTAFLGILLPIWLLGLYLANLIFELFSKRMLQQD